MKDTSELSLLIDSGGTVRCVYDESIDLRKLGTLSLRRASHVEPDCSGAWWADLAPVAGPKLGPFDQRSVALAVERQWLETHWLGSSASSSIQSAPAADI